MPNDFMDYLMGAFMFLICCLLALLIGCGIYEACFSNTECKVYSELKTRHGFIMVGKTAVPTTYQARDCLVSGEKEKTK